MGAVTQNGGFIRVESQPGVGTTFIIELPEVPRRDEGSGDGVTIEEMSRGNETIIVADDDEGVRTWIGRALGDLGYTVLQARDGEDVLRLFSEHPSEVRLVLTELVMPRADGREVGERMAARAPDVPVLYMSAYTESEVMRRRLLTTGDGFLPKPFSPSLLAERVRAALDGTNHHPPAQADVPSR
jgi:DNA-binding response OmpR family regulator